MIFRLLGLAAAEIVLYSLLKQYKPEYAVLSEAACAAAALLLIASELSDVRAFFVRALESAGIRAEYASVLLKTLGAALVTQFAANAARDNGQSALAEKIEFAGKVIMLSLALPVLKAVLQLVTEITENI